MFFRDQRLTEETQIAFSRRFGELEIHIVKKYMLPDHTEILLISNIRDESGEYVGLADAGFTWHSDTSYRQYPSRCSLLDGQALFFSPFAICTYLLTCLP